VLVAPVLLAPVAQPQQGRLGVGRVPDHLLHPLPGRGGDVHPHARGVRASGRGLGTRQRGRPQGAKSSFSPVRARKTPGFVRLLGSFGMLPRAAPAGGDERRAARAHVRFGAATKYATPRRIFAPPDAFRTRRARSWHRKACPGRGVRAAHAQSGGRDADRFWSWRSGRAASVTVAAWPSASSLDAQRCGGHDQDNR